MMGDQIKKLLICRLTGHDFQERSYNTAMFDDCYSCSYGYYSLDVEYEFCTKCKNLKYYSADLHCDSCWESSQVPNDYEFTNIFSIIMDEILEIPDEIQGLTFYSESDHILSKINIEKIIDERSSKTSEKGEN